VSKGESSSAVGTIGTQGLLQGKSLGSGYGVWTAIASVTKIAPHISTMEIVRFWIDQDG